MPVDRIDPKPPSIPDPRSPAPRSRLLHLFAAAGLAAASYPASPMRVESGPDWIDARLERSIPRERVGIPHCEAMVAHQKALAKLRDSIGQFVLEGRASRSICVASLDTAHVRSCLDSLDPLRNRVKTLRLAERRLQDSVRVRASRCDAPTFKAWLQFQALCSASDSMTKTGSDSTASDSLATNSSFDKLVEHEFASIWNQERMSRARNRGQLPSPTGERTGSGTAFRDRIRAHLGRRGAQNPSAMTHFLMAVLDHRDGRDDLALIRLRKVPARDSTTVWRGPVAMLYGQILAPTSPDSATPLLTTAMRDPALLSPALYLLAEIELRGDRPLKALAHLSDYLANPVAPSPGSRPQAIELAAKALVQAAEAPYQIKQVLRDHLPATARDTIAFEVARSLLAENAAKECIEILSSFQVSYPGTHLGDEVRMFLSQVRRNRPGIVVR